MQAECYFFLLLIAGCLSHSGFEQIGDGYYYIGSEKTAERDFDWILARRYCWRNLSNLVSVETPEELTALEDHIVSRGYPDGSTFATSAHNFYSDPPFSWEGADKPVSFARWTPGSEVSLEKSYLCLELNNKSLYLRRSYGLDDYFICEYRLSVNQVWLSLEPTTRERLVLASGCLMGLGLVLLLVRWMARRRSDQEPDDKKSLIP